jgi:hypothetical protein
VKKQVLKHLAALFAMEIVGWYNSFLKFLKKVFNFKRQLFHQQKEC